ncbi:hypothetical protein [Alkalimarinus coralli]|uniref:hypothetical protein n=1 Tax=Alkalimarinus coralli TaxID=2935863 RepID=UPI00202AC4DA|nr:hypothetical protein [Alkalimarinus coralli]
MDTVEIVLWAEEEFGVPMPDEEVGRIYTVGEFAKYIAEKVNSVKGGSTTFQDTLLKVIDILVKEYGVDRDRINTSSKFVQDLNLS